MDTIDVLINNEPVVIESIPFFSTKSRLSRLTLGSYDNHLSDLHHKICQALNSSFTGVLGVPILNSEGKSEIKIFDVNPSQVIERLIDLQFEVQIA